jgi:hypothetical protein
MPVKLVALVDVYDPRVPRLGNGPRKPHEPAGAFAERVRMARTEACARLRSSPAPGSVARRRGSDPIRARLIVGTPGEATPPAASSGRFRFGYGLWTPAILARAATGCASIFRSAAAVDVVGQVEGFRSVGFGTRRLERQERPSCERPAGSPSSPRSARSILR